MSVVKITPNSADQPAKRSHTVARVRGHSHNADPSAVTPKARYADPRRRHVQIHQTLAASALHPRPVAHPRGRTTRAR